MSEQFKITTQGAAMEMQIKGLINEDAVFPELKLSSQQKVIFNLEGVQNLNSCGIREWIKWLGKWPSEVELVFKNCPKVIVDQINMVAGFLPSHARVQSFYVPYFCENCNQLSTVLFEDNIHFNKGKIFDQNRPSCVKCHAAMEMDVLPAKYFKFLNR